VRPAKRYDVSPDVADFDDDALGRFRDDGFVAVPDLFRGDRLRQLIAWVDELESESEKRGEAWFYYEDSLRGSKAEVLARIEYFDAFHVGLRSVMRGFDSYAPHRSAPNDTDARRRVLLVTYGRARESDHRESYFAAKFKSFPPDIEREAGKEHAYKV
jgi:hypothetical protein